MSRRRSQSPAIDLHDRSSIHTWILFVQRLLSDKITANFEYIQIAFFPRHRQWGPVAYENSNLSDENDSNRARYSNIYYCSCIVHVSNNILCDDNDMGEYCVLKSPKNLYTVAVN